MDIIFFYFWEGSKYIFHSRSNPFTTTLLALYWVIPQFPSTETGNERLINAIHSHFILPFASFHCRDTTHTGILFGILVLQSYAAMSKGQVLLNQW